MVSEDVKHHVYHKQTSEIIGKFQRINGVLTGIWRGSSMFHQSGRLGKGDCTKLQDPDRGRILADFIAFPRFFYLFIFIYLFIYLFIYYYYFFWGGGGEEGIAGSSM